MIRVQTIRYEKNNRRAPPTEQVRLARAIKLFLKKRNISSHVYYVGNKGELKR